MNWLDWYNTLEKPSWTPAPATIGLIWQCLYPVIAVSFCYVFIETWRGTFPKRVAVPFAINLIANLSFTPIQFGLRNLTVASVDILIVWGSILWMVIAIWPCSRWVAIAQGPYLVWVSMATILQLQITWSNVYS